MVDIILWTCVFYASRAEPPTLAAPLILAGVRYDVRLKGSLSVWKAGRRVTVYSGKLPKPWRLEVGDVDLDGRPEIVVGVYKKTWNLHFLHTTIFVLGFDGHKVFRRWTGSTMGRPLKDFCIGRGNLYTLERRLDGQIELTENHWNGFGFRKTKKLGNWHQASGLKFKDGRLSLVADGHLQKVDFVEIG